MLIVVLLSFVKVVAPMVLPIRRSARVVLWDSQDRLLLARVLPAKPADPISPILKPYWVTLGGGVEAGETLQQAAARELWEEAWISDVSIGPVIWHGQWSQPNQTNDEHYLLVRLPYPGPVPDDSGLQDEEKSVIKEMKWWRLSELEETDEIFIPRSLPSLLSEILTCEGKNMTTREINLSTPKVGDA